MIKISTLSAFVLLTFSAHTAVANDSRSLTVPGQQFPNQHMINQLDRDRFMRDFRGYAPVNTGGEPVRLIGGGGGAHPTPIKRPVKPTPQPVQDPIVPKPKPVKPVMPSDPISRPLPVKKPHPVSRPLPALVPIETPAPVVRPLPSKDPVPNIRDNDNRGGLVNNLVRRVKNEIDRHENRPVPVRPIEREPQQIKAAQPEPAYVGHPTPVPAQNPVIAREHVDIHQIKRPTLQQFYEYEAPRENQNIRRMNNMANTLSDRMYYDQIREQANQIRRQNRGNGVSSFQQRRQQSQVQQNTIQNRTTPSRFNSSVRTPSRFGGGAAQNSYRRSNDGIAPSRF